MNNNKNIGIKFEIPNEWNQYLKFILDGVNISDFNWKITEDEIYDKDMNNLFDKNIIDGEEFERLISTPKYYTIFANIQAFPINENIDKVKTYKKFKDSNCNILILICDNTMVEVFVKNKETLNVIIDNIKKYKFKNMKILNHVDNEEVLRAN